MRDDAARSREAVANGRPNRLGREPGRSFEPLRRRAPFLRERLPRRRAYRGVSPAYTPGQMDEAEWHATPEDAARGDIPARYARAVSVTYSADGHQATVELETNEEPFLYPYSVYCSRGTNGMWREEGGHNRSISLAQPLL